VSLLVEGGAAVSGVEQVLGTASSGDWVRMLGTGSVALSVSAIDTVLGGAQTDTVVMLSAGNLSVSNVETVQGTTATSDAVQMMAAGTVALSAVDSVIGTTGSVDILQMVGSDGEAVSVSAMETVRGSGGTDSVTLLASGGIAVSNVETVVGTTGSDSVVYQSGGTCR
jgi:ribulose 1,5-bisphosphate carboxylase large subunit-like protein